MEILSWNVNGIRAVIRKGFLDFLKKRKPDILCMQEIKISDEAILKEQFNFPGYEEYWNSAKRPGYSGTATLVRIKSIKPLRVKKGINKKEFDDEGRVQILEFDKFYLVNAYFPHANHELSRLDYKLNFDRAFLRKFKNLESKKPVIICGDFNVAHKEIDIARPKSNIGNPGFTKEERAWMDKFLSLDYGGFIDTFRHFNKDKIQYTWWSNKFSARDRNIGWRIDYFCVSNKFLKNVKNAFILDKIKGSDHCPIGLKI